MPPPKRGARGAESPRRDQDAAGCGCLALVLLLVGAFVGYRWIERGPVGDDFNRQAESVAKALVAANELSSYLERQQAEVQERNRIIAGLKEEEGKIRPLLQADRATVTAILEAEARQRRQEIWLERVFSFLLGVVSSLVATWVWNRWYRTAGQPGAG
jgi:hypothetical protein